MIDTGAKAMRWITSGTISSPEHRALRYTALLFAVALLLHGVDHLRRGLEALTPEVYWGGTALTLVAASAVVLALPRYDCATPVALAVGLATAILTSAAHLLPRCSAFCDPFPGSGVDALSWAAVLAEIAAALAFAAAGAYALRGSPIKRLG
jgi:hypothetical protein